MRQRSIDVKGLSHSGAPIPTACRVGPILVTSRIMGKNPETGEMPSDPDAQAALALLHQFETLGAHMTALQADPDAALYRADSYMRAGWAAFAAWMAFRLGASEALHLQAFSFARHAARCG